MKRRAGKEKGKGQGRHGRVAAGHGGATGRGRRRVKKTGDGKKWIGNGRKSAYIYTHIHSICQMLENGKVG